MLMVKNITMTKLSFSDPRGFQMGIKERTSGSCKHDGEHALLFDGVHSVTHLLGGTLSEQTEELKSVMVPMVVLPVFHVEFVTSG